MLLAVAKVNTGEVLSCIQVKMLPNTRADVPPSPPPPAIPFSISSIHNTQGAIASAVFKACLMFASESPTYFPNILPISNFNKGIFQALAIHFAVKDLPQPGIPTSNTPLGGFNPKAFASSENVFPLNSSHLFNTFKPPTSSKESLFSTYSKIPLLRMICFFSLTMLFTSDISNLWSSTKALERQLSISA